jgi:hypothetical protein
MADENTNSNPAQTAFVVSQLLNDVSSNVALMIARGMVPPQYRSKWGQVLKYQFIYDRSNSK